MGGKKRLWLEMPKTFALREIITQEREWFRDGSVIISLALKFAKLVLSFLIHIP